MCGRWHWQNQNLWLAWSQLLKRFVQGLGIALAGKALCCRGWCWWKSWLAKMLQRLEAFQVQAAVSRCCGGFGVKSSFCRCFRKRRCVFLSSSAELDVEVVELLLGHLGFTVLFFKPTTRNMRFGQLRSGATLSGAIAPVTIVF
jgi:hypothetical protein